MQSICNSGGDNAIKSEQAFNEFFCRYKSYLLRACRKCCYSFDSSDLLADDIFQNTLLKVLSKAHTFKVKNSEAPSKTISNEVKAWLSRIAYNELINFLRKNPDEKKLSNPFRTKSYEVEETIIDDLADENAPTESKSTIQKNILDAALNKLSEREKYVLMAYMQYFVHSQPLKHLPNDVLDEICSKYSITPDNVRQIKARALKKLKTEIDTLSEKN